MLNSLDEMQIKKLVDVLKASPELGVTVTKAKSVWRGGFKIETAVKDFKVLADEPCSLGGSDSAPNPMALLLSAYGACLSIVFVFLATMKDIQIEKLEIELEGDVDIPAFLAKEKPSGTDSTPGFNEIRTKVFVKSKAALEELEEICEQALAISPVGQTMIKPVKLSNEFSKRRLA
ncbi:OsmC-like protein [bacterium BMS3Bbin06]|nr:OsmC-like protein [bacterium BMS3Abin08]GBE34589.1 OsmC-like protein [bacterium BMS3Bbin06]